MSTRSGFLNNKAVYILISLVVFGTSFSKIADLDFWWHLKTGQLILEQKAIPHQEIYSITAAGREYIDHEWLFQVIEYFIYSVAGPPGITLLKSAILILIYLLAARTLFRNRASPLLASGILLLSICGALVRFIERPEVFTILYLVLTYILLDSYLRTGNKKYLFPLPLIVLVWSNTHAAVILGLFLQFVFFAGSIVEMKLGRENYPTFYKIGRSQIWHLAIALIVSFLITGLNPYGYRMLKVPFELTGIIDSGILKNQEWQQPTPWLLPFYYACLIFTFAVQISQFRRLHIINFLYSSFLAYISLKYVRNVGIFCMMMPLLVSPYVAILDSKRRIVRWGTAAAAVGLAFILIKAYPFEFGWGEASYFPDQIVRFTRDKNLKGNMLNSYGFGGYLIWSLYPDRKIFIDGRNEVYLPLLKRLHQESMDSRGWSKLLADYHIEYALLNYVDDLEQVTSIDRNNKVSVYYEPFTSTRFPRSHWALIYWDDDGMILIKRNGMNQKLVGLEYSSVFPEGRSYQRLAAANGMIDSAVAIRELQRKLAEEPSCRRARSLLRTMLQFR
jgi:hypothetical protein